MNLNNSNIKANKILFSFIIPVFNTGNFLLETLDSINEQDFDLTKIEVIITNDCSTDEKTNSIITELAKASLYKNINIKIIENKVNKWAAESRNIAAKNAIGEFIVCLDSDDVIERDFLKLSYLTFLSYPNASWVYPSVRKFGYKNQTDIAPNYNAKNLFLQNYLVITSPVKRTVWNKLKGQKTYNLVNGINHYEDWDFWQRAIGKGYYGVPSKKVTFNYRQNVKSLVTRSEEEGTITTLMAYRNNWKSVFGIKKSQKNYDNYNKKFTENKSTINNLFRVFMNKLLKRNFSNLNIIDALLFIVWPNKYIIKKSNPINRFSKAHKMAGFIEGFSLDFDNNNPICNELNNTVLCTHFWWHIGGAENILLDFLKELKGQNFKIIDIAAYGSGSAGALLKRFSKTADSQFVLDEIAHGPFPRLVALWEIIKQEKPKIILNMSNPYLYILSPLIKKKFPNTIIYDLLHCEDYDDNGWFEAAYQYQNNIDKRIVTSHFWKDVLIQKYNEKAEKIDVVYNMINYDGFSKMEFTRNELLIKNKIDPNKKIIGFLGRFEWQKRPDIFVRLTELMKSYNDYHFVMIGEGTMYAGLEAKMKSLSNLTYLGATKNPETVYPMFDIAIFPSKYEGYPLVGIECAYIGLPIIASNIVGFSEQIINGKFGLLYDIKGDDEDAEAIKELLINKFDEIIKLGKNGTHFINEFHNEKIIKESINKVFSIS
jgi:glycosyltransferase involved in cell wall biosynthesis